jgi:hypothetical protein
LDAKGCGDAFIPYHVTIGIGREFRPSQMITMQEGDVAARCWVITSRGEQSVQLRLEGFPFRG